MTLEEVRQDLEDIRCFYTMQKTFVRGASISRNQPIVHKVDMYNKAIAQAPAKLYVTYMELYVENNTQERLGQLWGYTEGNIRYYSRKLCEFLMNYFNKQSKDSDN